MSTGSRQTLESMRRLLQAARGSYTPSLAQKLAKNAPPQASCAPPLRCFPLRAGHVGTLSSSITEPPTPNDFHAHLCRMIRNAKRRVHLASLYVGAGTAIHEQELLHALSECGPEVEVKLLLDENRALRPVNVPDKEQKTSSAEAVYQSLERRRGTRDDCGLYLFQALPTPHKTILPSPLNEIAGVFHIKAYIVDDELILSGANLSEEYFHDRQDRYFLFTDGGGGIVDFYSNLVNVLCRYADRYRDQPTSTRSTKTDLLQSLSCIMDGTNDDMDTVSTDGSRDDVIAYAVPTFQAPRGFFPTALPVPSDADVTRNLLQTAYELDTSSTTRLASAYLNPTKGLVGALSQFSDLQLLTAGPKSHGFAPKPGITRRGDWVPSIFSALSNDVSVSIPHAQILLYEREGWTFHSKGLWVSVVDDLIAATVGSGNYGSRSEKRDLESNCIFVFPQTDSVLQRTLINEWESMCQHVKSSGTHDEATSWKVRAALPFIRELF